MSLKSIGSIKSTSGVINHFVKNIQDHLLNDEEELSKSPTSFVNLLLDQIGSINAANFFEMISIKQEAVKSTAKLRRSLIRYLNSEEITDIFGTPAIFSFNLGFKTSDLITHSERVENSTEELYKVTINKDSIVALIDRPVFTFDNNIDIYIRKSISLYGTEDYNFFAKYNPEIGTVYGTVSNPFIKSFTQIVDGEKYFVLNLLLKQYERNYTEFNSLNSSSNKYEFFVPYSNKLSAFEVMYKSSNESNWEILLGEPDGVLCKDGYNFSLVDRINGIHAVNIKFSRNPEYFSPINGSSIKIVTYTTHGKDGNFIINGWDEGLPPIRGISFNQNVDDKYEVGITKISPLITISTPESSGGKDEMSIDDLRNFVNRKDDSKVITLTELEEIAESSGLRFSKERSDILDIYYRLSGVVKSENIIDSTSGLVELDLNKVQYSSLTSTYILSPKNLVKYDNEKFKLINNDDITDIISYINNFNKLDLNISERDFFFPYFMRINLSSYVDSKVFDMSINDIRPMIFEYFNESSTSEASIDYCSIIRDPMNDVLYKEEIEGKEYSFIKGVYKFTCNVQISELIYDQPFENDLIRIYIKLIGKETSYIINDDNVIITKIDDDNKIIKIDAEIFTDCGIDVYDHIGIVDDSIKKFPRQTNDDEKYLMESEIDLSIYLSFKGTNRSENVSYDSILTNEDITDGFNGISAIYTLKEIQLIKDITNIIKPIVDIKVSRGERLRYEEDIPDRYEETIFETDEFGDIIYETVTLPDGSTEQFPIIIHKKYDIKYDEYDNTVYLHRVGDFMYDEHELPIYEYEEETLYIEVRDFPLIDRIYSEYGNYNDTISAFKSLVDKVESYQKICPTGTSGKLGVLNTIGSGNYFFINRKTGIEESLDRLALSFHIGIKPENEEIDEDILIEMITSSIVNYIQDNSSSKMISFMEMLNDIKEKNYGIKYFELYKVNNYQEGVCHSIYSKSTVSNFDIVTIKNSVSVEDNNMIFTPDIKITII